MYLIDLAQVPPTKQLRFRFHVLTDTQFHAFDKSMELSVNASKEHFCIVLPPIGILKIYDIMIVYENVQIFVQVSALKYKQRGVINSV